MKITFLIVTKNRARDLTITLHKLKTLIEASTHEVLVFIDGCKDTETLIDKFHWVKWMISPKSISASPARHKLYKEAKGDILIGLDDDAHPISPNFINEILSHFRKHRNTAILAFQEVRGIFAADEEALLELKSKETYKTNDFVGCGFAVRQSVYKKTRGFPTWVDIYGEESALAIEVLDLGYDIIYQPEIAVNHRVNVEKRKKIGRNYFRFEHQFKNTIRFYIIYYPNPILKLGKILWHNFKTYAVLDKRYLKSYFKIVLQQIYHLPYILKHRKPVAKATIHKRIQLKGLKY